MRTPPPTTHPARKAYRTSFYTIDTAVPVPAQQFGFYTPPQGFRSDGTPLNTDATPAFDVSIGDELEPVVTGPASKAGGEDFCTSNIGVWLLENCPLSWRSAGYAPFQQVVASVAENLDPTVHVDFPRQYVRYFRWRRQLSVLDEEAVDICPTCGGAGRPGPCAQGFHRRLRDLRPRRAAARRLPQPDRRSRPSRQLWPPALVGNVAATGKRRSRRSARRPGSGSRPKFASDATTIPRLTTSSLTSDAKRKFHASITSHSPAAVHSRPPNPGCAPR